MTPSEYFESQAYFNANLKEMSEYDKSHIVSMIGEYAIMCVEECRTFVLGALKEARESPHQPEPVNFTDGISD
jgi:hypothetical protein